MDVQLKPSLNLTCQLKSVSNHTLPVVRLLLPASSLHKPSEPTIASFGELIFGGAWLQGRKFKIFVTLKLDFYSFVYFFTNKTKTDPNHKDMRITFQAQTTNDLQTGNKPSHL